MFYNSFKIHDIENILAWKSLISLVISIEALLYNVTMTQSRTWSLEIGSFMVLLGDQQESAYRLMQRCLLECLTAAPVAGLQSYLRPFSTLAEARGLDYISPYGCKLAPLRNMRLSQTVASKQLLRDGRCSVYQIARDNVSKHQTKMFLCLFLWILASWVIFGGIIASVYLSSRTTWIGTSSCASLTILSIFMRLVENRCLEVPIHPPSAPKDLDAVIFMGRRNSCFVLEGSREDVARWTGFGLQLRRGSRYKIGEASVRLTSLVLLLYIFVTVPNGSTWDQVAFVCLNLLGQLNNVVGSFVNGARYFTRLEKIVETEVKTRTHALGFLLRRFGNGPWVDEVKLIPGTAIWKRWRAEVLRSELDPKLVYDLCCAAGESEATGRKEIPAPT